ncbi:MAG: methyltransferase domain-containing protein [Bacteroidales bacterium]|nr:methyltransferase domain-containing protein [Bacteroidales bacterium]
MQYDPIKRSLGKVFNKRPFLRILFYKMLDVLLLRAWHVKKEIRKWAAIKGDDINILDAGSGFGQYSYFLSSINEKWRITGLDVKEEQIADCNRFFKQINRRNANFRVADLTKFIEHNTYDLVLSVDVMEHILEDVLVFENLCKSMKPGAMLIISTPSDQGGSDVHDHSDASFIDEHVRDGYNIDEIRQKLTTAGFSRTEVKFSYGPPGKISWRLSMKYPIQMLNFSRLFFILLPFYYLVTFPLVLSLNLMDVEGKHKTGTGLIVKAWK